MVKTLFKHEFKAWLRVVPLFWLAMLGVAVAGRIVQFFETDSIYYKLIFGSAMLAYGAAAFVVLLTPTVFGVYRFYRNLFTGEGYLSFTLPVTPAQHLWVKVITAVCFDVLSLVVLRLSGMVLICGELLVEVWKAAGYLWKQIATNIPKDLAGHLIGYAFEYLVIILAGLLGGHLMYQSCICIGQLARKNRVLLAVGVYFGYQLVVWIISTVLSVVFTVLSVAGAFEKLLELVAKHPFASGHVLFSGLAVFTLALAALFWWISHRIMSKRLNLE